VQIPIIFKAWWLLQMPPSLTLKSPHFAHPVYLYSS